MRNSPERTEIAKMRVASGLLQKEAAALLGVSTHQLKEVECGRRVSRALCERAKTVFGK